jgi:hypothetical protein
MRRAAKTDANQTAIIVALRAIGASVQALPVGDGVPDLLIGYRRVNFVIEVKDGAKIPSKRKLNKIQRDWHDGWKGTVHVVESPEQALQIVRGGV